MKCFRFRVRVCRCFFGFIVVVNGFVVGLFLFFEPVTMCHSLKKSAHVMVLLWIWRAVWKDQLAFLKTASENRVFLLVFFFPSGFYCLAPRMAHNQVLMQRADWTLLSDEQSVRPTCVFLYAGMLPAQVHLQKGKASAAVVTLGNILLPVLVAHIRPLCYRCHGLHFPSTPAENLSAVRFVMLSSCLATVFILFVLFIVFFFDPFIK